MLKKISHKIIKLFLLTMLSINLIVDVSAEAQLEVDFEQLDQYWHLSSPRYRPATEFIIPLFSEVPKGETAEVIQSFIITSEGKIKNIKTISSSHDGLLVEYGLDRISSFVFKPSPQNSESKSVLVIIRTYIGKMLQPILYKE